MSELREQIARVLYEHEALVNAAREPLHPDARMQAYYYSFDRTGCGPIDALLSAVAVAGKGSHGTDCWGLSDDYGYYDNRPGLPRNPSVEGTPQEGSAINLIELTATDGAAKITAALAATNNLVAALRAVLELHREARNDINLTPPCDQCHGEPGVHPCGCWADEKWPTVCAVCTDLRHGYHLEYPCPTVRAIEEALG